MRGADFREMRESYELRTMLETRAIELAAPYSGQLIAELTRYLRAMEAAAAAEDPEQYIDHSLLFHRRLVESGGNRTFLSVWDSLLWDIRGRIALRRLAEKGRSLKTLANMHRTLLRRMRAGDACRASQQLRTILSRVIAAFAPD